MDLSKYESDILDRNILSANRLSLPVVSIEDLLLLLHSVMVLPVFGSARASSALKKLAQARRTKMLLSQLGIVTLSGLSSVRFTCPFGPYDLDLMLL